VTRDLVLELCLRENAMTRLKLADWPVKAGALTLELSRLHRDLVAALAVNGGDAKGADLRAAYPPMLERFIATDRAFAKARKTPQTG
jgi:hypothetical protein